MQFCPHCKSALLLEEREGQVVSACSRCGHTSDSSRKSIKTFDSPDRTVFVIEKDEPPWSPHDLLQRVEERYNAGEIDRYEQLLQELVFQDAYGRWWAIDRRTGKWVQQKNGV